MSWSTPVTSALRGRVGGKSGLQGSIVNLTLDGQPAEAGKKRWEGREGKVRRKEERKERDFYTFVWGFGFLAVVFYFHCTII